MPKRTQLKTTERGQSLVELTIVLPILLLMLLGLLETGIMIQNYLKMSNVTREVARYASREVTPNQVAFTSTLKHYEEITTPEFREDSALHIHILEIDLGRPCLAYPCLRPCARLRPSDIDTTDDVILSPASNPAWHTQTGEIASTLDYAGLIEKTTAEELIQQCRKQKRDPGGWVETNHVMVVAEVYRDYEPFLDLFDVGYHPRLRASTHIRNFADRKQ